MRAHVVVGTEHGTHELEAGALIGRLPSADLHLDDPRVSEAHAMVSLRGDTLRLLALRGRLAHQGQQTSSLTLAAGQEVFLAPTLSIRIEQVVLPDSVLALEAEGLPRQVLAGVCSLGLHPLRLTSRFVAEADAWLWGEGEGWTLRTRNGMQRPLRAGSRFELQDRTFTAVAVPLGGAAGASTRKTAGLAAPVRVVAHYDTVEIHPQGGTTLLLNGVMARLVSELVLIDGPVAWQALAEEVWGTDDPEVLRHRLDVTLSRLRARLRRGAVRSDLVRSDGAGALSLLLHPEDVIEDRT